MTRSTTFQITWATPAGLIVGLALEAVPA